MTDLGVGDVQIPWLQVTPAGTDTTATLTVHPPTGDPYEIPATGGPRTPVPDTDPVEETQRWTATQPVTYTAPGRWVLHWQVTGTGEGTEDVTVHITATPAPGGPTWAPSRAHIAAYVPHRTLVLDPASITGGQDTYQLTFTDETRPPGSAVDRLITDAVAWVAARVTPLHATSQAAARTVAAIAAAAAIERSWPHDDQSLQRANDMERRMDTLMTDLLTANTAAAADPDGDPGTPVPPVAAVWSFPPANPAWDSAAYW